MERYFLIIFLIFLNFDGFHGFNNSISVRLVERGSVILECNDSATKGNKWFLDDRVIFANELQLNFVSGVNLVKNYSLSISDVTINHQGLYRCDRNYTRVVSYNVTIEVIPELTLSFDEHTFSEPRSEYDYLIKAGEPLRVKCMAVGSRPPASLTWIVNGEDVDPSDAHNVLYKPNKERINTTDSESTLHLLPAGTHVNISCQIKEIELVSQNLTINFILFESSDKSGNLH
ncbi:putative obscurin-like protein 1 isoform X10 [Apostichopus japonicus]|uniref:Putative obscurin-like protein 1 isoform X10 n=1 Tax=Stichopus japonicus TaxID=307972 RepID=A0A2G8JDD1_STIJA|nr:putative obscurin-like protein 1 isoform X10 [Apostichopus japonicus]